MGVKVFLESFEKPEIEYLVPFQKITQILEEHGYLLEETKMFSEVYSQQTNVTLTQEQQTFSFLNRTFVFKRGKAPEPKTQQEVVVEEALPEKEPEPEPEKPKKRKLKLGGGEPEPEPALFHGAGADKGQYQNFSNDSAHPIEIDGVKYATVTHFVESSKAKEFGDEESREKIGGAKSAKAAKALGDKVKNYNTETWEAKRDGIMEQGLRAKFVQHPELRKELDDTGDKTIGEADARDTYWGLGTGMESVKSKTPSKWRGLNKMGKLLMDLRRGFREQI